MNIQISREAIQVENFAGGEHYEGHGAKILFFGVVRKENLGRQVVSVSYDAFVPLAEQTLRTICEEAKKKFGNTLIINLIHCIGDLKVGDVSLAISVSSRHRDESYLASRYIIEELKIRAPIWKKEIYEDGESEWLKGHALCGPVETPQELA